MNSKSKGYILLFIGFIILLWRAHISFCWSDESFYFSTASRFFNGDKIFFDEWFPTQLSSVALLPFYSVYVLITGSTTGIILYFRIIYVIIELISSIIVFKLLKDIHGEVISTVIALCVMFYSHLNIATVSYYTMSIHFFVLSLTFLYRYYFDKARNNKLLIFAGFCLAISVLNLPTLSISYVIIVVGSAFLLIINTFIKRKFTNKFKRVSEIIDSMTIVNTFKFSLVGIIIPAAVFFLYLLNNVSMKEFVSAIPYVLSDDEHITSFRYPLIKMYSSIIESYGAKTYYLGVLITLCSLCVWGLMILSKYRSYISKTTIQYCRLSVLVLDVISFILYFYFSFGHTGYIQTAIMMFSIPLFFMSENKNYKAMILYVIPGLILSLTYSYSSNGMLYLLSMGHFVSSIGGIIIISNFINEIKSREAETPVTGDIFTNRNCQKAITYVLSAIVLIITVQTCLLRITNVYRDDKTSNCTKRITSGPAAGLYTNSEHHDQYNNTLEVINKYCVSDDIHNTLLVSKLLPWAYLCTDLRVAAPTTWRTSIDSPRLKEYYGIHPEKRPDVVLIMNERYGTYETCGDVEYDPTPNENDADGYILDYVYDNDFEKIPVSCGVIYRRK